MTFVRIWRYRVASGRTEAFARAYAADGDWAGLFRRAAGYLGTELLLPVPPAEEPLTLDRWRTAADWQRFLADHGAAYRELDRRLAPLTVANALVGEFDVGPAPILGLSPAAPSPTA